MLKFMSFYDETSGKGGASARIRAESKVGVASQAPLARGKQGGIFFPIASSERGARIHFRLASYQRQQAF